MKYGNHEFIPYGNLDKRKFKELWNLNLRSHTELKMWDLYFARIYGEEPDIVYSHIDFYIVMGNCEDDMFLCDNGKVYIPCEHELMEFIDYQ